MGLKKDEMQVCIWWEKAVARRLTLEKVPWGQHLKRVNRYENHYFEIVFEEKKSLEALCILKFQS